MRAHVLYLDYVAESGFVNEPYYDLTKADLLCLYLVELL